MSAGEEPFPPYSYVPGGPWPHPIRSPEGHMAGIRPPHPPAIEPEDGWLRSAAYLRGLALFNAGYYWEAHESWEGLWHAHGRKGPVADVLKGLIKLAAAGVKVREGQPHGVATHARRAAALFAAIGIPTLLGLDLARLAEIARELAENPPVSPATRGCRVIRVFEFSLST